MTEEDDALRLRVLSSAPAQAWVTEVAVAVAAQDFEALVRLDTGADMALLAGGQGEVVRDEFFGLEASSLGRSAKAVLEVGRSILDAAGRETALAAALAIFATNRIVSARSAGEIEDEPTGPAAPVIRSLRESKEPAGPFVELLALHLIGQFPGERGDAAIVPVLLDPQTGGIGVAAHLRLALLSAGPAGLHPDPRRMSLVSYDEAFASSLRAAWALSPLSESGASVVWSLVDGEDALLEVGGASLGAAFAVALDDLAPRTRLGRQLRRRSLNAACAVTGQLRDGELQAVSGYEPKLRAAARRGWRVVVPAESMAAVKDVALTLELKLEVSAAQNVEDAVRLSRTRTNSRFVGALLLAIMLVVGGGGGATAAVVAMGQAVQQETERRTAAELAAEADDMLRTNPRLASLLALLSYELDPSVTAASALLNVAGSHEPVIGSVIAHTAPVTEIVGAGEHVLTVSDDRTLASWTMDLDPIDRMEPGKGLWGLSAAPDGSVAAVIAGQDLLVIDVDGRGNLTERARVSALSEEGTIDSPIALVFTSDAAGIDAVFSSGLVRRYGLDGKIESETDLSEKVEISARRNQIPHFSAAAAGVRSDGNQGRLLLVSGRGDVYDWDPEGDVIRIVVPRSELPGPATSVRLQPEEDRVLIGTENGATSCFWWATEVPECDALGAPLLEVADNVFDIAVAESNGTVAVRHGREFAQSTVSFGEVYSDASISDGLTGTAIGAAGSRIFLGTDDGRLLELGESRGQTSVPPADGSTVIGFTPEGQLIRTEIFNNSSNDVVEVQVVDISDDDNRPIVESYRLPESWGQGYETWYVNTVQATEEILVAGGLAPGGTTGLVMVWSRSTGEMLYSLDTDGDPGSDVAAIVNHVQIMEDGRILAGFNVASGVLTTWSLTDGNAIVLGSNELGGGLASLEYDPEENVLYALTWPGRDPSGEDHEIVAIDGDSGAVLWREDVGGMWRLSRNPVDGRLVLMDDTSLQVRSPDGAEVLDSVTLSESSNDIAWDPQGSRLAVLSQTGRLRVLEGESFSEAIPGLWTGDEVPFAFGWNPDGSLIAVATPRIVDGQRQVGPVLLFRPDPDGWAERVCQIAGGAFTEQEWAQMVGSAIPYRDLCAQSG